METIVLPYAMYTTHQQYQYVAMVYIRRQLVAHMFCNLYPKQHLLGVVLLQHSASKATQKNMDHMNLLQTYIMTQTKAAPKVWYTNVNTMSYKDQSYAEDHPRNEYYEKSEY